MEKIKSGPDLFRTPLTEKIRPLSHSKRALRNLSARLLHFLSLNLPVISICSMLS